MRWAVYSDLQGNQLVANDFFERLALLRKDFNACLGDIVGERNFGETNEATRAVRTHTDIAVRGNHEDRVLENPDWNRRMEAQNRAYLQELPLVATYDHLLFYHSSLRSHNYRMHELRDFERELETVKAQHPQARIIFHGHTHKRNLVEHLPSKNKTNIIPIKTLPPSPTIELREDAIYMINPGGVGLLYNEKTSFALYDDDKHTVRFFDYPDFVHCSDEAKLALAFSERWYNMLTPQTLDQFVRNATADAQIFSTDFPQYRPIIHALRSFDFEHARKLHGDEQRRHLTEYGRALAAIVSNFTSRVDDDFSVTHPQLVVKNAVRTVPNLLQNHSPRRFWRGPSGKKH